MLVGRKKIIMLSVGLALLCGALVFGFAQLYKPPMGVLYSNLSMQDSSGIIDELESSQVPFELKSNGSTILIPQSKVTRIRMQMASKNLPIGGGKGYELFDNSDGLGMTDFIQNLNFSRALEGELARTISSLDGIKSARVHISHPNKRTSLFGKQNPRSASVLLSLKSSISRSEINSIRHLVANAVDELSMENITITDSNGKLLIDSSQEDSFAPLKEEKEKLMESNIVRLLESALGVGNVRATVSIKLNRKKIEEKIEDFNPDTRVLRSNKIVEEGLPRSNQSTIARQDSFRNEEINNYEISKVTKVVKILPGSIKSISAAVMINDISKDSNLVNAEKLANYEDLIKSIIGFDAGRGDIVKLMNVPFAKIKDLNTPMDNQKNNTGLIMGMTTKELIIEIEKSALILITLLLIALLSRPLIKILVENIKLFKLSANNKKDDQKSVADKDDDKTSNTEFDYQQDQSKEGEGERESSANLITKIAEENKESTASLIKRWIHGS